MIVWAFETLLASTLLMALVLAIRTPVRRAFGPNIAYALWALPAARMVLPPLPAAWREAAPTPLAHASETLVFYVAEPLGVGEAASNPSLWPWVLAAWATGALGFIAYHLIAHDRFTRRVRRLARSVSRVASGKVEVIETDAATGPLAFGVIRKYVAFPRDFAERYDPLERDLALAHELGHHARGDLIANWAALVVLALHWFNPVAWRAFRAFRADQECACDALVLAGRAAGLRHAYARAIVKSAHGGAVSAACHLHTINELKGRLKMLQTHESVSRGRMVAGAGAIVAVTLAGLGLTASGTQAAERVRTRVETTIGVDLATIDVPTLPPIAMLQAAPPPPPAVGAVPAPPAAPAPIVDIAEANGKKQVRIIMVDKDDRHVRDEQGVDATKRHRFVIRRDGKTQVGEWDGNGPVPPEVAARLKDMPEVTSRDCGPAEGDGKENVIRSTAEGKRRIVICTNRIAAAGRAAAAHAQIFARLDINEIERNAMGSARASLERARRSIEMSRDLSDSQRSEALRGIAQAMRELGKDKAD